MTDAELMRCACVSPDAAECIRIRYGYDEDEIDREECSCCCHACAEIEEDDAWAI